MEGKPKQYGLIISQKKGPPPSRLKPQTVFDEDAFDDERDSSAPRNIGEALKKEKTNSRMKLETQTRIHEALAENPDAFAYDDVYDQIQEKKAELEGRTKGREKEKDRKPKYVEALIQASKERNKEWERRNERKIQREREEEGGEFADKESFVTSAYKKKMEEQKDLEAREKALEAVEAKLDVTKQKDMGLFYKHLLKQETGEETVKNADQSWRATNDRVNGKRTGTGTASSDATKRKHGHADDSDSKRRRESEKSDSFPPHDDLDEPSQQEGIQADFDFPVEEKGPVVAAPQTAAETAPRPKPPTASELKAQELERRSALFAKRTTEDSAMSARERYLARQAAKQPGSSASPAT